MLAEMRARRAGVLALASGFWGSVTASGAELPEHRPLSVLVVSDEVNPNNLSDAELTQPGDISAALNAPDSGLTLAGDAAEVSSQCADDALSALAAGDVDVLVYFAHRGAHACDGADVQAEFTSEVEELLENGGGVVVFHHGTYEDAAKGEILELFGVTARSIAWNKSEGQRVFNFAPGHFVTTNGVRYTGSAAFTGGGSFPSGTYEYFDNVPDERYPDFTFIAPAGENRTILFATNSGGTRGLGYALERPGWTGRVVAYQPGEYQPNALDDRDGPNFQILANAIVYAAHAETSAGGSGGGGSGGTAGSGGDAPAEGGDGNVSGSAGGAGSSNAGTSSNAGGSTTAGTSNAGGSPPAAGRGGSAGMAGNSSSAGSASAGAPSAGAPSAGSGGAPAGVGGSAETTSPNTASEDDSGCGCRTAGGASSGGGWLFGLFLLSAARRRFSRQRGANPSSRKRASVSAGPST